MTNPIVERLTGSLWMITKPGGYEHINQLGRVYRDKQVALRHKDFDEVVVELRLADEPSENSRPAADALATGSIEQASPAPILQQQMEPDTTPLSHVETFVAVLHHAQAIVNLTGCVDAVCQPVKSGADRE